MDLDASQADARQWVFCKQQAARTLACACNDAVIGPVLLQHLLRLPKWAAPPPRFQSDDSDVLGVLPPLGSAPALTAAPAVRS